jgi:DNA-binding beta-propeller fold protein YncE
VNRREFLLGAAALALAPNAAAAARGRIALVTADLESRLVVVDLERRRVLRHVETLGFPRSIETVGECAVVAHPELGAISIVHARTLQVARVLRGFAEPRYTAAHPDGRHAYVTDAVRGEVVALDVVRGVVLGRAAVGARARHVSIDPAGRRLWVALGSKAREVAVVDVSRPQRPRLVRSFAPPFLAHDVVFAPDRRHAWVSSGDRFELAVYDRRTGSVVARPSADWPPQHVTFAGDLAYVTSGWSGTLRVHRADGRALARSVVPVGSYNVQQGGGFVVTPSLRNGDLCILDERGRTLSRLRPARSSHDACVFA